MKSFAVICVLLHIRHGQAGAVCSGTQGSCATRKSSLMQLKSLQQKTSASTTLKSKLAGFQQFTEKMIAKYGQDPSDHDGSGVDDSSSDFTETLPAVALVLDFIQKMGDTLLDYHKQDLLKVGSCTKIYDDCIDEHLTDEWNSSMHESKKVWEDHQQDHVNCRGERKTQATDENAHCGVYDTYRQDEREQSPALLPDCVAKHDADGALELDAFRETYIRDMAPGRTTDGFPQSDLYKMEECLETTAEWLHGSDKILDGPELGLYDLYTKCTRTNDACSQLTESCRQTQHSFESTHCNWNINKNLKCQEIYNCVNSQDSSCDEICDGVEADAAARAADNETGRRLICLLSVLFGKQDASYQPSGFAPRLGVDARQAALNGCKDDEYDTTFWEISCPTKWKPTHPNMEKFPFSCECQSLSDSDAFKNDNYFVDPPGLGQICSHAEEEAEQRDVRQKCCLNMNISTPAQTCSGGSFKHCDYFSVPGNGD